MCFRAHAMNRPLPYKDFKWVDSISIDTIMNYDENSDIGYTLEVDLHYPKELHAMCFKHMHVSLNEIHA